MPDPAPVAQAAAATDAVPQQPAGDVIVIPVRRIKLWAWAIAGAMIGAMLAGALVVPFFGAEGVVLGSLAGIVTIFGSGFIGMRLGRVAVGS